MEGHPFLSAYAEYETFYMILRISVKAMNWKGALKMSIEQMIEERFVCSKCGGNHCQTKEVSMSGAGLSKMFDIQHNHFLFVSCTNCGYVEVFNPDILEGKKRGQLGSILDVFFG